MAPAACRSPCRHQAGAIQRLKALEGLQLGHCHADTMMAWNNQAPCKPTCRALPCRPSAVGSLCSPHAPCHPACRVHHRKACSRGSCACCQGSCACSQGSWTSFLVSVTASWGRGTAFWGRETSCALVVRQSAPWLLSCKASRSVVCVLRQAERGRGEKEFSVHVKPAINESSLDSKGGLGSVAYRVSNVLSCTEFQWACSPAHT